MPNINEFTFWKASCVQNPKNCIYPTKVIVTDADSFNEMAHFDHVPPNMRTTIGAMTLSCNPMFSQAMWTTITSQIPTIGSPERISTRSSSECHISYRKAKTT